MLYLIYIYIFIYIRLWFVPRLIFIYIDLIDIHIPSRCTCRFIDMSLSTASVYSVYSGEYCKFL